MRASDLDRTVRGVRSQDPLVSVAARCRALLHRRAPGAFVSHLTAAQLWGAPVPSRFAPPAVVDLAVRAPARAPHATGIRGHRIDVDPRHIVEHLGLPITSPARTWVDAASMLPLGELVALGDRFIRRDDPLTARAALEELVEAHPPRKSGARLRRALRLLSDRAESRPESLLRVLLVEAGFPPPQANYVVVSTESGARRRLDLAWPDARVVVEYQGDYHRDKAQWRADMQRRRELEAAGWTVIEANWDDIVDPSHLLRLLSRRLGVRAVAPAVPTRPFKPRRRR